MMPWRLARPSPLPLYLLPSDAVVYWFVLGPLEPPFENGRGVALFDATLSGRAVPALPLRSPCTRCCIRIMPPQDYV